MATNFPTSLQDLDATRGTTGQKLNNPDHITHHTTEDDTIEALQAKVGVDNSAVATSLDYLVKSASSTDPGHKHPASKIVNTPAGNIVATTVQAAIDELDTEKAPIASPSLTGTATLTNSTDAASVQAAVFQGDRATPADGDTVYFSFKLSNDLGTQTEFARMSWSADDVNNGTGEEGSMTIGMMYAGSFADRLKFDAITISPLFNNIIALGTSSLNFADLFLGDGGVINFNGGDITLTHSANTLTLGGGDLALGANNITITGSLAATGSRVTKGWFTDIESTNMPTVGGTAILSSLTAPQFTTIELGHATDTTISRVSAGVVAVEGVTVPTISSTNTLTNKRVTPRVSSETSSATPTINTDNVDAHSITALATAVTSMTTNLSGTPTNFQKLIIRFKDDGTARAITWGASFEAKGVALPTTTVISKVLTVGFIYDTVTSKWGCVASAQEA